MTSYDYEYYDDVLSFLSGQPNKHASREVIDNFLSDKHGKFVGALLICKDLIDFGLIRSNVDETHYYLKPTFETFIQSGGFSTRHLYHQKAFKKLQRNHATQGWDYVGIEKFDINFNVSNNKEYQYILIEEPIVHAASSHYYENYSTTAINNQFNIMGDYFSDIKNATIINRSTVENAFNKIKENFGEETAAALVQLAKMVEQSGNQEAGEVFNAFTEEIQKPQPKKSLLKSFWNGLTTILPTISTMTGITEKVMTMIG